MHTVSVLPYDPLALTGVAIALVMGVALFGEEGAQRFVQHQRDTTPLGRLGHPRDIGTAVAFLMSFENFNTTLMLVGSDAPLTITMFDRMKEGSTPILNAVSLLLMVGSSLLALMMILVQRRS